MSLSLSLIFTCVHALFTAASPSSGHKANGSPVSPLYRVPSLVWLEEMRRDMIRIDQ